MIIMQEILEKTAGRRVYHMVVSFPENFKEDKNVKISIKSF